MNSSSQGSYLALAGLIVSALAHFNIVTDVNSVTLMIGGLLALYGVVRQLVVHKQVVSAAQDAGVAVK